MKMKRVDITDIVISDEAYAKISFYDDNLFIWFNDVNDERWKISFRPIQSFKVTTIDCVRLKELLGDIVNTEHYNPKKIIEIKDSLYIENLNKNLKDLTAGFLSKSHHYIFLFDDLLEVIAWDNYELEKVNN